MKRRILPALVCGALWSQIATARQPPEGVGAGGDARDFRVTKTNSSIPDKSDLSQPLSRSDASLWVLAFTKVGSQIQPIQSGATLHSGDRLALQMYLDRPAYVYTLFQSSSGQIARLYPERGDELIEAGGIRRVPRAEDTWLEVDNKVGNEHLFVIAHEEPMTTQQLLDQIGQWQRENPEQAQALRKPRSDRPAGSAPPPKPAKGPDGGRAEPPVVTVAVGPTPKPKLLTEVAFRSMTVKTRDFFVASGTPVSLTNQPHRPKVAYYRFLHR